MENVLNVHNLFQDDDDLEEENHLKKKMEEMKEKITRKKDFLEENKPKIEDFSSHDLYFKKENLNMLMQANLNMLLKKKNFQTKYFVHQKYLFRQFNKNKNKGDFVIIHPNPDYFHQIMHLRRLSKNSKKSKLLNFINDDKIYFMRNIPGKTPYSSNKQTNSLILRRTSLLGKKQKSSFIN